MAIRTPRPKAFSLIELVIMLAIISVLAAIAGPRYANSLALYRVQAAAGRIAGDLTLARWQARTSGTGQTVVFSVDSNRYTLPGVTGPAGQPSPYTVKLASEPYLAALVSATFGLGSTATFDQYGQPAAGGSVVVRSGAFTKTIVVDPNTGLSSVQ